MTGVFCQGAIEGAQADLDITIEGQLKDKQVYVDRLKLLLKEMRQDDTQSGLTAAELEFQLSRPKVQSWFKALDIDSKHAWKLFRILDSDHSGNISSEKFVEGCLHLKGMATRVDVESLKFGPGHQKHCRADRNSDRARITQVKRPPAVGGGAVEHLSAVGRSPPLSHA